MPRARKVYRKRRGVVRRRKGLFKFGRRQKATTNRALQPVAQRYICKMKYATTAQLNLNNAYLYQLNLNSLFDPDRTGTGHQPYMYDQLSGLYNRYRVIGCSYTIFGYPVSSSAPIRVGALATNDASQIWNNMSDFFENPKAKWTIVVPGGQKTLLKGYVSIPSLMGRNNIEYRSDDRFQAQVSVSPAELAILNIGAGTMTDTSTDVNLHITMNYVVEFFDIKNQAQS